MQRKIRALTLWFFCFVVVLVAMCDAQQGAGPIVLPLNSGWEFRQRVDGQGGGTAPDWRAAQVPGVVHTDLLRNGLIPDPFYRTNEAKLQWIENADWEYRSVVQVSPEVLKRKNVELVFEGLDTVADVYINGTHALRANNMFREWRIDAKPLLKTAANELLVVFPSPIKEARKIAQTDKWQPQTQTPEKSYIRKAAYEYGWDWGPRFVTSGIWRPAKIVGWDDARISNLHIQQRDVTAEFARLLVQAEITSTVSATATVKIDFKHAGKTVEVSRDMQLRPGVNHVDIPAEIARPELWYPAGYGAQSMYAFHATLAIAKRTVDEATARTGLRSVVLRREKDKWGRSFELVVNGIPVFAKGANVIPFDSFPTRVTTADYRRILESAKAANMNMIRHWGGGYYETEEFYRLCDDLGIMVWQDFMFGNEWQPGTYDFKQNVALEAEYQIKRLREHPSIVLWCGNNETEASWEWGRNKDSNLGPELRRRMWQDYVTLFSGVIARAVERFAPETPYWPSSPSADYEDLTEDYQSGDMHNWSIWHGMLNFRDYEKSNPRFMTEYGFQSFPEMRTIEAFTLPEDRTGILTPVMQAHQKNTAGNSKIREYLLRDYPEPKDFASFLYVSQVLQAEGMKIGTEHLRRNRPRTMGALYWQLNDCWPVASWSSIDYYGGWKALHYYARRFFNDLLVSPHEENGGLAVYVVSDRTQPVAAELRVKILGFDGSVVTEDLRKIEVAPLTSKVYAQYPTAEMISAKKLDTNKLVVSTELLVNGKVASSNLLYLGPTVDVRLPAPGITSEIVNVAGKSRLRISSKMLARSVYVSFSDVDAKLSDNYFDLLPGQSIELEVESAAPVDQLRSKLKIMSLADAFEPGATPKAAEVK